MMLFYDCPTCDGLFTAAEMHLCSVCQTYYASVDQWRAGAYYCASCLALDQARHAHRAHGEEGTEHDASRTHTTFN